MTQMTKAEVLARLRELPQDQENPRFEWMGGGEYVPISADAEPGEGSCRYDDPVTHEPSCVAGVFFARNKPVLFEQLIDCTEMVSYNGYNGTGEPLETWPQFKAAFTTDALDFLGAVQRRADEGVTWGEAIDYAIKVQGAT